MNEKTLPGRPPQWAAALFSEVRALRSEVVTRRGIPALAAMDPSDERAAQIADMRRLIDWMEQHPELPLYGFSAHEHLSDEENAAANVATVRAIAERLGIKTQEYLDDRTKVSVAFGQSSYDLIAWHKDGRPAETSARPVHAGPCWSDCSRPEHQVSETR